MTAADSPEKALFVSTTQSFLDKEASLRKLRELHAADTSFETGWWQRAAQLGWAGLLVPEELGGGSISGNGIEDLALVAQEIGKTVAPGPLYPVSTVLAGLVDADTRDAHAATIKALAAGQTVATWAVYEPGVGWAPHEPAVTATATGNGYRIDGVKDRVESGAQADLLLVVARCDGGLRQFLVPTTAPGVNIHQETSIDMVKRYARVQFDDVQVGGDAAVGSAGQAATVIDRQSQIAQVLQCAETVGILDTVLGFTIQWAFDRHTFGRPLASYQALKHRFADMKMWFEACRATTSNAVANVGARSSDADLSTSIAKSYVGELAIEILQGCVQMHGGIGVTFEHDVHLFVRRHTVDRALYGTPSEHRLRIVDLTEQEGAA